MLYTTHNGQIMQLQHEEGIINVSGLFKMVNIGLLMAENMFFIDHWLK